MSAIAEPASNQPRVPAGVHTGGQFTFAARAEAPIDLAAARYATAPAALTPVLSEMASYGAHVSRLEDGRRWEIVLRDGPHQTTYEVEVVDGAPLAEVYAHQYHDAIDPRSVEDHDDYLSVRWDDPDAVVETLAAWAGIHD